MPVVVVVVVLVAIRVQLLHWEQRAHWVTAGRFSARMFLRCRRRSAAAPEASAEQTRVCRSPSWWLLARWHRLASELARLAFKRRLWAHLGRWLNAAKRGVRQIPDADIQDWWKAL